jgi:hypothetical protein
MPTRLAAFVSLLCVSSIVAAYDKLAPRDVDLSGRWAVNGALSDDADALLAKRLEKQLQRERRWRDQEAREEGAQPLPPAEPLSKPQTSRVLAQLRRALELYSTVEIKQSDAGAMIEIRGDGGQRRFTAGDRSAISMPEGQLAEAEVGWDGAGFVIDRKVRKGPHVVERYQLLKKTGQLQVIISWGGASDELLSGIKIKRVFDRSEGPLPAPDPDVGPVR